MSRESVTAVLRLPGTSPAGGEARDDPRPAGGRGHCRSAQPRGVREPR